jgi:hypothetical protein
MLVHFHHAAALHIHSAAGCRAGCGCADCKDWIFDVDTSSFVEFQRSFDGLALFKRMLEFAEHDVEARWRKRDGFSRLDFKAALYRAHFHNAAVHGHTVYFTHTACIVRNATDFVGCCAFICDRHVTGPGFCAFRRGARPWLCDVDRANIVVGRLRAGGGIQREYRS